MVENDDQLRITKKWIANFTTTVDNFNAEKGTELQKLEIEGIKSQIKIMKNDVDEYEKRKMPPSR